MSEEKITKVEFGRVREDLEDLERYIKEFSSFLPLAVCTINPPKNIIDVNQSFKNLTGYDVLDIIGEPLEKIFLEKKEIESLTEEIYKKEKPQTRELTLVSKEKKEIPVSVSIAARKDAERNFIGYFLGITDITEIKKSQEKLEERVKERTEDLENSRRALMNMLEDVEEARKKTEEEKNRTLSIITNFSDGLLVFNKENKLSLINPQAETFFNVKAAEITGLNLPEIFKFVNFQPLANLLGKEIKGIFRKELLIRKDLTLEISSVPIMSDEEELGTLVILHDITREKMVEKLKTEFVSLAAHQLRTPLSAIKWTLKMLLDGDLGAITKEQRDFIEKTYQSNERMIVLINDLLNVTRIEEGKYLSKPTLTDFENIVQFVVNSSREEFQRKKLTLDFKKPLSKLPKIVVDVEKISLVIQNLFENAIRYTPAGGKITIIIKHQKKEKEIEFQIKDSGIGIPADQQERVFTKFFRAANVMRIDTEGSGLGLFISKNIIEAHGGRIRFESEEGKGTTFYLNFPIKEEFVEFLKEL